MNGTEKLQIKSTTNLNIECEGKGALIQELIITQCDFVSACDKSYIKGVNYTKDVR